MKKIYAILIAICFVQATTLAQDLVDALRYSNTQIEGTARAGAMGNAFGALGGDFTAVGINPAGLGIYRSGELALSPYFGQTNIDASYLNSKISDSKYNFAFSNISYVAALKPGNSEAGIVSVNIGIGYNRLKDFNNNSLVRGDNAGSSFMDHIVENANYDDFSEYYEDLASNVDLLLYDQDLQEYWHDIQEAGYGHSQEKSISRRGSLDEYTLALGLNFSHKFYLGASLGIQDLYFKESSQLYEWDNNGSIPFLNEYEFDSYLSTTATGYNAKLGVIFKPTNEIRLGASVHTPTFFRMHDIFETSMHSSITYEDNVTEDLDAYSPYLEYDYDLETPLRATFSGAFVIAKQGLISIDYEYVDYSNAKLRDGGDGYNFSGENMDIEEAYKAVGNIRVGGEYRLNNTLSLRAGYELYPSAFNSEAFGASQQNSDANTNTVSAGLGYKQGGFFLDMAFRHTNTDEYNLLYPSPQTDAYPAPQMAKFENTINKVLLTFGFRF